MHELPPLPVASGASQTRRLGEILLSLGAVSEATVQSAETKARSKPFASRRPRSARLETNVRSKLFASRRSRGAQKPTSEANPLRQGGPAEPRKHCP